MFNQWMISDSPLAFFTKKETEKDVNKPSH